MISNASIKRLRKLHQKKYREAERLFIAEGQTLVEEAVTPPLHLLTDRDTVRSVSTLTTPTGPIGVFSFLDIPTEALISRRQRILLLHGVQDPGNVGTVIRTAHAFDAGIALSKGTADLYNPKTVRATMGSIFHAPISREVDTLEMLSLGHASGFETAAAVPARGESPGSIPVEKLIIVVGAEGRGLPEEIVRACSRRITIPAVAASLNAAVAASILLYEAYMRVLP